jgi:hypothetical protein
MCLSNFRLRTTEEINGVRDVLNYFMFSSSLISSVSFDSCYAVKPQDREYFLMAGVLRGPLSLVSTTEELLGRKSSGSGLEIRDHCRRDPSR